MNVQKVERTNFRIFQFGNEVKLKTPSCFIVPLLNTDLHRTRKDTLRSATHKVQLLKSSPVDAIQTPSVSSTLASPRQGVTHIPQLLHCLVLCSMSPSKGLAVHE